MEKPRDYQLVSAAEPAVTKKQSLSVPDVSGTPFKVVVDPDMRLKLKRALIDLIDYHDEALAEHFAEGKLALESVQGIHRAFRTQLEGDNGKPRRRGLSPARGRFRSATGRN